MQISSNVRLPGLTEYESRAYTSLLNFGPLTAERISSSGKVPLPRVYDTMKSLLSKGMVMVSNTRPKAYHAQKPQAAIRNLLKSAKDEMEDAIFQKNSEGTYRH